MTPNFKDPYIQDFYELFGKKSKWALHFKYFSIPYIKLHSLPLQNKSKTRKPTSAGPYENGHLSTQKKSSHDQLLLASFAFARIAFRLCRKQTLETHLKIYGITRSIVKITTKKVNDHFSNISKFLCY